MSKRSWQSRVVRVVALLMALAFCPASPAFAQATEPAGVPKAPRLALLDGIGYGGLGFGLGVVAMFTMPSDAYRPSDAGLATAAVLTLAGTWTGAAIGSRAQRRLAQGQPLKPAQRTAVVAGVGLAGATVGALIALPMINPEGEGTPLGSDEGTFALLTFTGAGLGWFYVAKHWDQIGRTQFSVFPAIRGPGHYSLNMRIRF